MTAILKKRKGRQMVSYSRFFRESDVSDLLKKYLSITISERALEELQKDVFFLPADQAHEKNAIIKYFAYNILTDIASMTKFLDLLQAEVEFKLDEPALSDESKDNLILGLSYIAKGLVNEKQRRGLEYLLKAGSVSGIFLELKEELQDLSDKLKEGLDALPEEVAEETAKWVADTKGKSEGWYEDKDLGGVADEVIRCLNGWGISNASNVLDLPADARRDLFDRVIKSRPSALCFW